MSERVKEAQAAYVSLRRARDRAEWKAATGCLLQRNQPSEWKDYHACTAQNLFFVMEMRIPQVMVLGMLQGSGDIETGSPAVHIVGGVIERG